MKQALELASRAERDGEVPVGAILIRGDQVIGQGWNQPIGQSDPTCHAEIVAIREAGHLSGNYRLPNSTLYVTLEPCSMCVGAIIHARIDKVVFGASDSRSGALGGSYNLTEITAHNHVVVARGGVLEKECAEILLNFFRLRRIR